MGKRVSISPWKDGVVFFQYHTGKDAWSAFLGPELAQRLREVVERNRWLGTWQVAAVVLPLLRGKRVPADARRLVKGQAALYLGRYQRALNRAAQALGARYVPGPRGGRWSGYYTLEPEN